MKNILILIIAFTSFNAFALCGRSDFLLAIHLSPGMQAELDANQDTAIPITFLSDGVSIINIDTISSRFLSKGWVQYDGAGNYLIEASDEWGAHIYISFNDETAATEGLIGLYTDEFGNQTDLSEFKCSYNDLF